MDTSKASADIDAVPGDGRDETANERLDRNWNELLQELRVTQTGTQILTGFLLALAFQPAFGDLDGVQIGVYLTLVVLAALSTVLGLAPVSLHRLLFHRGLKRRIVRFGSIVLRFTLTVISLLLIGVVFFVFDVVTNRTDAIIAGAALAVVVAVVWLVIPLVMRRSIDHGSDRA
ncbi:DUF6328 family protein [Plantibacter sp. YIM 135347]|uniref:DUF6328 family protein n=1 Tax=Plantibacter sp. YIM 135347 TaxID=3423919 RepID=UPI003D33B7EA